jgi:hypothetical protein
MPRMAEEWKKVRGQVGVVSRAHRHGEAGLPVPEDVLEGRPGKNGGGTEARGCAFGGFTGGV